MGEQRSPPAPPSETPPPVLEGATNQSTDRQRETLKGNVWLAARNFVFQRLDKSAAKGGGGGAKGSRHTEIHALRMKAPTHYCIATPMMRHASMRSEQTQPDLHLKI